jgi:hypothetical protein
MIDKNAKFCEILFVGNSVRFFSEISRNFVTFVFGKNLSTHFVTALGETVYATSVLLTVVNVRMGATGKV